MTDKIDISVITACYNSERYIKECIESVQQSKLEPLDSTFEHIIVNDGSLDNSEQIIKQFNHIVYLKNTENEGPASARNKGINAARGTYIFVLDSDDVLLQRTLYHCVEALRETKHSWLFTDFVRSDAALSYKIGKDYYGWQFASKEEMLSAIFSGTFFIQHNTMFEKALFNQVGGYDPTIRMAEDLDLYIRFLLAGRTPTYLPITSHIHRLHDSNLSIGQGGEQHMHTVRRLKKKYDNTSTMQSKRS